ncbi:MAG: DUF3027 domain-containing protein [Candidatus Nanopelagicales bacterium]
MHDFARSAVLEVAGSAAHVGDLLDTEQLGDVTVVRFASLHPGYPHWHWSVALVGEGDHVTINEIWMEPGEGALRVPEWKPWSERVRPGDLGAGDVVPTAPDDDRLTPGYTEVLDDEQLQPLHWELGLNRERVLSPEGLADAAERWRSGDDGPDAQVARLAPYPCSTCAWLLPIGGRFGQAFGVCAHDISPSDGHVVALDHGCGAHSSITVEPTPVPVTEVVLDDEEYDALDRGSVSVETQAIAPAHDVTPADEPDGQAGEGDIAPPQDAMLGQDLSE